MKTISKTRLGNHPTMINDCYRIVSKTNKGVQLFRSIQPIMKNYAAGDDWMAAGIDNQLNSAISELEEAVKMLKALKKNYKTYAAQL